MIFDELNNEIEQLKTRNESLDKLVEVFYSQFWNNNDGEKVKIDNDEIKVLKKENEKLTFLHFSNKIFLNKKKFFKLFLPLINVDSLTFLYLSELLFLPIPLRINEEI